MRTAFWRIFLLILLIGLPLVAGCQEASHGAPRAAPSSASAKPGSLKLEKIQREVTKLDREVEKLQLETSGYAQFLALVSGIGGLATAAGAFAAWWIGHRVTEAYKRRNAREAKAAKKRHEQLLSRDRAINREQHNMKLFSDLGNDNPRTQVAAAIVLLGRLEELRRLPAEEAESEQKTIRGVLASVLKKDPSNSRDRPAFFKTVAEGLARDVGALNPEQTSDVSPLKDWDFQQAVLKDVYWKYVNGRGVDFFGANFEKASLREARLEKAVFYGANLEFARLDKAKLCAANLTGAKLSGANFQYASLEGADFTNASIDDKVNFEGATFNDDTKWPEHFPAQSATKKGAKHVSREAPKLDS